jgi:Sigma-70, region 4
MLCVIVGNLVARRGGGALPGGRDTRALEGAFLPCSFWLVQALVSTPQGQEAAELFEQLLAPASPVGLYGEEMDPVATHWGGLPACEQKILLLRFYGGMTQDETGQQLAMSQMQVSRPLAHAWTISARVCSAHSAGQELPAAARNDSGC